MRCAAILGSLLLIAANAAAEFIPGTATYRERITLPGDAVFEATLEDVSRADARGVVIGHKRVSPPGVPPFNFEIAYHPGAIQPTSKYVVRTRVTAGGRVLLTTDSAVPVLTQGHGSTVSITMRMVASNPIETPAALDGTAWDVTALIIGTRGVARPLPATTLTITFAKGTVSGSAGCNTFRGSYTESREDHRMTVGKLAATLKACEPGVMDQERRVLAAIESSVTWAIDRDRLDLRDSNTRRTVQARLRKK